MLKQKKIVYVIAPKNQLESHDFSITVAHAWKPVVKKYISLKLETSISLEVVIQPDLDKYQIKIIYRIIHSTGLCLFPVEQKYNDKSTLCLKLQKKIFVI